MTRTTALVCSLLAVVLAGCGIEGIDRDRAAASLNRNDDGAWTLLFYLAADNAQEGYADATLSQLLAATKQAASPPQVIVLVDRLSEPGTEIFEVVDGEMVAVESHPEEVTSDGAVLQAFATLGLQRATREKVAFVMKSEGLSWRGIGRDNTHAPESPDTLMPCGDLAQALVAAQAAAGVQIDLLVLEGSIMAFIEVVYELRDAAPLLLASQSKLQPDGIPWRLVIDDLDGAPDMAAQELAIAIADDLLEYYSVKGNKGVPALDTSTNFAAMTVFDTSQAAEAMQAHSDWADATWPLLDEIYNLLPHARDLSDVGGFGDITEADFQSDIKTFMVESRRLIGEAGLSFPELDAAIDTYLAAQDQLVVHMRKPADGAKLGSANGLSIWYPPTWNQYQTQDAGDDALFGTSMVYEDPAIGLDWVTDTSWVTYLEEYFDRAAANLAGNGPDDDEPPKPGVQDFPGKKD
jgi:hypothetical protein